MHLRFCVALTLFLLAFPGCLLEKRWGCPVAEDKTHEVDVRCDHACETGKLTTDECAFLAQYCQDHRTESDIESVCGNLADEIDGGTDCTGDAGQGPDGGCIVACTDDDQCAGSTPHCDTTTGLCVACTEESQCILASNPHCELSSHECVACRTNDDCGVEASFCDPGTHTCLACTENTHCAHFDDTPFCATASRVCVGCIDDGDCSEGGLPACNSTTNTCVACNPATELSDCSGFDTCDPVDHVCTGTASGTIGTCESCRSDSDCDPGYTAAISGAKLHCVEMTFQGTPHGDYGYCLLQVPDGTQSAGCPRRYPLARTRTSRNGVEGLFCVPLEDQVTCEALLSFGNGCGVVSDSDGGKIEVPNDDICGAVGVDDGICRPDGVPGGATYRCTYPCATDFECRTNFECTSGETPNFCCTSPNNCPP